MVVFYSFDPSRNARYLAANLLDVNNRQQ